MMAFRNPFPTQETCFSRISGSRVYFHFHYMKPYPVYRVMCFYGIFVLYLRPYLCLIEIFVPILVLIIVD